MLMLRRTRILFVLLLLLPTLLWADPRHSQLVVFGDSLTDTGNLYSLIGIPPDPPYYQGRSSNGPLWVEYLAPRLKLDSDVVVNHAWVGAKTGRENVFDGTPGLPPTLMLPGLLDAIDYFSAAGSADPKALYIVWIGSNDLLDLPADPYAAIQQGVFNIVSALEQLKLLGARKIAVINVPDLGLTPVARATGTTVQLTALSYAFNLRLRHALRELDPAIITIDVFSILRMVSANPEKYGFTNVTDSCLNTLTGICSNPDEYMFWDHVHPTTRGHAVLARLFRACLHDKRCNNKRRKPYRHSYNDD